MILSATVIGSGNVAKALCPRLIETGIKIQQIFSRKTPESNSFCSLMDENKIELINDLERIKPNADIYILAVKDDAIKEVSEKLSQVLPSEKIIAHLSGSSGLELISEHFSCKVCIWPMYSFSGTEVNWQIIPLFVSSNQAEDPEIIRFVQKISSSTYLVTDKDKLKIHIAAVFANNFSNYNLRIAKNILQNNQIPLSVFKPMMDGMISKIFESGPEKTQSGPAMRKDYKTIQLQEEYLQIHFPQFAALYKLYSDLISSSHIS